VPTVMCGVGLPIRRDLIASAAGRSRAALQEPSFGMTDVACLAAMISAVPSATRTSTWSRTNFRCDLGGALATGYPPATPS
jgi:hypothetical protein